MKVKQYCIMVISMLSLHNAANVGLDYIMLHRVILPLIVCIFLETKLVKLYKHGINSNNNKPANKNLFIYSKERKWLL